MARWDLYDPFTLFEEGVTVYEMEGNWKWTVFSASEYQADLFHLFLPGFWHSEGDPWKRTSPDWQPAAAPCRLRGWTQQQTGAHVNVGQCASMYTGTAHPHIHTHLQMWPSGYVCKRLCRSTCMYVRANTQIRRCVCIRHVSSAFNTRPKQRKREIVV